MAARRAGALGIVHTDRPGSRQTRYPSGPPEPPCDEPDHPADTSPGTRSDTEPTEPTDDSAGPTDTQDTDDPDEVAPYTLDADEDGLSDGEEAGLGLDPGRADSDGDGYGDKTEVDGNTDAADPDDHPYAGGWAIDACRDNLGGEGDGVGDTVSNFALTDQHGESVSVHDCCDRALYVVFAAFW